jgi:hypothetical protein
MQAHAGTETWRAASLSRMAFLPEEAKQMRQELRRLEMQTLNRTMFASNEMAGVKN